MLLLFVPWQQGNSDAASLEKVTAVCKQDVTIKLPGLIEILGCVFGTCEARAASVYEDRLFGSGAFQMRAFLFQKKKNSLVYFPIGWNNLKGHHRKSWRQVAKWKAGREKVKWDWIKGASIRSRPLRAHISCVFQTLVEASFIALLSLHNFCIISTW